jgi:hypothetical protein
MIFSIVVELAFNGIYNDESFLAPSESYQFGFFY